MHLAFFALPFLFLLFSSRLQDTQAQEDKTNTLLLVHQTRDTKYNYRTTKGLLVISLPIPDFIVVVTHRPILDQPLDKPTRTKSSLPAL